MKASRFIHTSEPLVFDAMNPQQKALWARRVLRVVWVLTDTADLTTTKLEWLRDWKWGEHSLEFLSALADGPALPIPRLWSRTTILDRDLEEWERWAREAMRALRQVSQQELQPPYAVASDHTEGWADPLAARLPQSAVNVPDGACRAISCPRGLCLDRQFRARGAKPLPSGDRRSHRSGHHRTSEGGRTIKWRGTESGTVPGGNVVTRAESDGDDGAEYTGFAGGCHSLQLVTG
jgi:hypothetical protein